MQITAADVMRTTPEAGAELSRRVLQQLRSPQTGRYAVSPREHPENAQRLLAAPTIAPFGCLHYQLAIAPGFHVATCTACGRAIAPHW